MREAIMEVGLIDTLENDSNESTRSEKQSYSLRTLMFSTALIAWILGVNNWLGEPYGWLTAIPLIIGLPVFILRPMSFRGGIIGFVFFALIGEFFIIGWNKSDPQYLPCLVTVGGYGLCCAAGIHACFLGLRFLGSAVSVLAVAAFAIVLITA
ncbi:MAG: hypothetical protein AAF483_25505 [Planctomycetota bacterium]